MWDFFSGILDSIRIVMVQHILIEFKFLMHNLTRDVVHMRMLAQAFSGMRVGVAILDLLFIT